MDRNEFLDRADACLQRVESWLEDFDPDELDFEPADGVVKLQFADGTTFVLNRQTAPSLFNSNSGRPNFALPSVK